jgi:hypothetical protein
MFGSIQVTAGLLLLGVVYFILGYLLFAVVSLALRLCITGVPTWQLAASMGTLITLASARSSGVGVASLLLVSRVPKSSRSTPRWVQTPPFASFAIHRHQVPMALSLLRD